MNDWASFYVIVGTSAARGARRTTSRSGRIGRGTSSCPVSGTPPRPLGAALLGHDARRAGFVIGAAALSLLLIGIHNAWDTVTHLVVSGARAGGNDVED